MRAPASPTSALSPQAIAWGPIRTPFGSALVAWVDEGLCALEFGDGPAAADVELALARLQAAWPGAPLQRDDARATEWSHRIHTALAPRRPKHPVAAGPTLPLVLRGSPFRQRVWRALLEIPAGEVCSYGELARAVGAPQAARAVGGALAANPLGWVVPCHRVVRADGDVHHYRWGAARKQAMLRFERGDPVEKTPALASVK